ncbi:BolA family protein [Ciceribacter sp. L1K22]|uniref:BolA family protein n=1 Tax=Ciceribacter sp. L1K22 TaxID=2820275 RepID=UPI001ABDC33C|nr:BolA family protein [Ciceribacter sp. L1K22]MBO3762417.1 BolA family transcriptional regulator [Ciceribacter sp. L1K22]
MSVKNAIETKLSTGLAPDRLVVIDESGLHAGHGPRMDGTGETHMRIRIVSPAFAGLTRVARHRAVTDLLKAEFDAGLHALAIEASAPGEPTRW